MSLHTFVRRGVTDQHLASQMPPGYTALGAAARPPSFQEVDLQPDDAALPDLITAMDGWDYIGAGPAPMARTIKLISDVSLAADTTAVSFSLLGAAWTDVPGMSLSFATKGGSRVLVVTSLLAGVLVAGRARTLVSGGSFSNAVVGPDAVDLAVLSGASFGGHTSGITVPATASETTYTVRVQVQAPILASAITARRGSTLAVSEYV